GDPGAALTAGPSRIGKQRGAERVAAIDGDAPARRSVAAGWAPEVVVVERPQVEIGEDEAEEEHDRRAGDDLEADAVKPLLELRRLGEWVNGGLGCLVHADPGAGAGLSVGLGAGAPGGVP